METENLFPLWSENQEKPGKSLECFFYGLISHGMFLTGLEKQAGGLKNLQSCEGCCTAVIVAMSYVQMCECNGKVQKNNFMYMW